MFHNKRERFNDTFSLDDLLIVFKIFKINFFRSFIIHTPIDGHFISIIHRENHVYSVNGFIIVHTLDFPYQSLPHIWLLGCISFFTRGRMKILMQPMTLYFINQERNKMHFFFIVLLILYNTNIM